jgi:hypothetical protein
MPKLAVISLLIIICFPIASSSKERTLEISGLKIYSEEQLYDLLNLERFELGRMTAKEVIDAIVSFYSGSGYTLVKVYIIEDTDSSLKIYVDEGALGKIIFLSMDDFTTLYLKIVFKLKNKVFNYYAVEENIEKLKKGKRWKYITWQLKPVKNYDTSIVQIDRALNLEIMRKMKLAFFDRYSPRFDLVIVFNKTAIPELEDRSLGRYKSGKSKTSGPDKKNNAGKKIKKATLNKFDYGLKINYYKGFIPYLKYYHLGLISAGDFFMGEASAGFMYGLDRKFARPPRETYSNLNLNYFFTPTFKDVFTPLVRLDMYQSKAARPDLGLREYKFLLLNAMFAPGITLLRKFNFYTGVGVEAAFIFQSKKFLLVVLQNDPVKVLTELANFYKRINQHVDTYAYLEAGAIYDFSKKSSKVYELRKNRLKKDIAIAYDFYILRNNFHTIRVLGNYDHEFKDRSIYSGGIVYQFAYGDTPFYREGSVSNNSFMGLQRFAYFSRNALSQSNEYRFSVYQDFLYVGVFFDMTFFEGSGRDLKGAQFGIVGGPTVRVLILDHFELYLQYGWDYLVSTKSHEGYLYFNIYNKW